MKKRDFSLDVLRILACLMVVGIHTAMEGWYNISPRSYNWIVLNFYDTLVRPAVPLFFMISGALFLSKGTLDIKKLWTKNILHLFIIYVVWVVFYAVMNNGVHKVLADPSVVWHEITGPNPQYHLWYLRSLMNCYAVAPLLWYLVRALDRKGICCFLTLFLVFGILRMTVADLPFLPKWILEQINLFVNMDFVGYTGYFLLGYFLYTGFIKLSRRKLWTVYIVTLLAAAGLNQLMANAADWPTQALYGNFTLPVMIEACCIFLLVRGSFAEQRFAGRNASFIVRLSTATLFVYLIHPFVLSRLQIYFHLYTTNYNVLFSVPIFTLLVFIVSAAVGMLLERVPVLRRIL